MSLHDINVLYLWGACVFGTCTALHAAWHGMTGNVSPESKQRLLRIAQQPLAVRIGVSIVVSVLSIVWLAAFWPISVWLSIRKAMARNGRQ